MMINKHTKSTTIKVSPEVRNQLWMMKQRLGYPRIEDVVLHLLSNQKVEA